MTLEERISSAIRSQTELVEPWAPDLDSIRRTARTQARRRAAVAATCVAAAVAVVVTAIGLGGGLLDRSVPPVDRPPEQPVPLPSGVPDDGVVRIPAERAEQVVVTPTVRSTVTPGTRVFASLSSEDTSYDGSGELSVVLDGHKPSSQAHYSFNASCDGAPGGFLVVTIEPNASYFRAVRCDGQRIWLNDIGGEPQARTLRSFVTEDDPQDYRRCFNYSPPEGCDDVEPPRATDVGASFTLKVREVRKGPIAAWMFEDSVSPGRPVQARAAWQDRLYSLTTVAAGATGAAELSFRLDASLRGRIAQATWNPTPAFFECMESADDEESEVAACYPTLELVVDGQPFGPQRWGPGIPEDGQRYWPGSQIDPSVGWDALAPDEEHEITLRVVEGDPKHVDLGVVVFEED